MKILLYNSRPDEKKWIDSWNIKHPEVQIDVNDVCLDETTVSLAKGYDAISVSQSIPMHNPLIYQTLNTFGIKVFGTRTVGTDFINFEAAKQNDIRIVNVPGYSPRAIAELAFTQSLYLMRNLQLFENNIRHNDFRWHGLISPEVHTLTIGIIGTGRIGFETASLFHNVGCKVLGYDPYPNPNIGDILQYTSTLEELVSQCDIISLHLPLLKDTTHIINGQLLDHFKKGTILVNTARGGLIDTSALINALENKTISACALDTIENETQVFALDLKNEDIPDENISILHHMPQVLITPHIAFYTQNAVQNIVDIGLQGVFDLLTTNESKYEVMQ